MTKNILIITFLLFILMSAVLAQPVTEEAPERAPDPANPRNELFWTQNPNAVEQATPAMIGAGLDAGVFPADQIPDLSGDKLEQNAQRILENPDFSGQLTDDQRQVISKQISEDTGREIIVGEGATLQDAGQTDQGFFIGSGTGVTVDGIGLTNAEDALFTDEGFLVSSADEVSFPWGGASDVEGLTSKGQLAAVDSAGELRMDCITVRGAENVVFGLGEGVAAVQAENAEETFEVEDCGQSKFQFKAAAPDAFVRLTTDENPLVEVSAARLAFSTELPDFGKITELLDIQNTAQLQLRAGVGLECADYEPLGLHAFQFDDRRKDFGLRVFAGKHKICSRKVAEQSLDCAECTVVDFIDKKIQLDGTATYSRDFSGEGTLETAFTGIRTQAEMDMDDDFMFVEEVRVNRCETMCHTRFSNYLSIYDVPDTRYLDIATQLQPNELQTPLIRGYSSQTPASAVAKVSEDNVLDYSQAELNAKVLPSGHNDVKTLRDNLKAAAPTLIALGLLLLIPVGLFRHRRGVSITLFIIVGMVILLVGGLLFTFRSVVVPTPIIAPTALGPEDFVNECFKQATEQALDGYSLRPVAEPTLEEFSQLSAENAPGIEQAQLRLEALTSEAYANCVLDFLPLEAAGVQIKACGDFTPKAVIDEDRILFDAKHCIDVGPQEARARIEQLRAQTFESDLKDQLEATATLLQTPMQGIPETAIQIYPGPELDYIFFPVQGKLGAAINDGNRMMVWVRE